MLTKMLCKMKLLYFGAVIGIVEGLPSQFTSDWMGYLSPMLHDKVLLDVPLPGTHDTLTYDLDDKMSKSADDVPGWVHEAVSYMDKFGIDGAVETVMKLVNTQAVTQTLDVVGQLDAGIRFMDLRVSYEDPGWYGFHFTLTKQSFESYLKQIRSWLNKHRGEFLMIALTHHGDGCADMSKFTDDSQKAKALAELKTILVNNLQDVLVDDSLTNTTTLGEYLGRGKQVALYTANQAELGLGLSHCTNVNQHSTGADVTEYLLKGQGYDWQHTLFSTGKKVNAEYVAKNSVHLISGATSANDCLAKNALAYQAGKLLSGGLLALSTFAAGLRTCFELGLVKTARANMDLPLSLQHYGWLTNFYSSAMMDYALGAGAGWGLPTVMYLDQVGTEGTLTWGGNGRYPYLASMLKSKQNNWGSAWCKDSTTVRNQSSGVAPLNCEQIGTGIQELLRARSARSTSVEFGYEAEYPPLPKQLPQCAYGYQQVNSNQGTICVAKPFQTLSGMGDMCGLTGGIQCSANDGGVVNTPWEGHAHGKCVLGCTLTAGPILTNPNEGGKPYVENSGKMTPLHSLTDPSKYYFCAKNGTFTALSDITSETWYDFQFTIGGSGATPGHEDPYHCETAPEKMIQQCAKGFREISQNGETHCYLEPYKSSGSDNCGQAHCTYEFEACSSGYSAHAHGKCTPSIWGSGGCHDTCQVNQNGYKITQGLAGNFHSITDLSKYHICDTDGNWHPYTASGPDFTFNNGEGNGGSKDDFKCKF
uniref:Phosphatidylinositol-specific phospholipase C X domain-containing protein n=1 Tax=Mucochytrium quahogii TaxID=96639 RepID=A0A7S2SB21_9STRA|mmetsp:Transcript_3337/g.7073  ORF Transcript_3337/g.7073 Transcript_3337/m.7073 type:complete len:759 (+) Transcript_3337:310-2586(+)